MKLTRLSVIPLDSSSLHPKNGPKHSVSYVPYPSLTSPKCWAFFYIFRVYKVFPEEHDIGYMVRLLDTVSKESSCVFPENGSCLWDGHDSQPISSPVCPLHILVLSAKSLLGKVLPEKASDTPNASGPEPLNRQGLHPRLTLIISWLYSISHRDEEKENLREETDSGKG